MKRHIIQVALPIYQDKTVFDYYSEQFLNVGSIVIVPFRDKELVGVVWSHQSSSVNEAKLKSITSVIPNLALSAGQVKFLEFVSRYNISSVGRILKAAIPFSKIKDKTFIDEEYQYSLPMLNPGQSKALASIEVGLDKYNVTLLEGVTGSGKTEVYAHIIAQILQHPHQQVLLLLPEIMLTAQFVARFEKYLGIEPKVWHSLLPKKNKQMLWESVAGGNIRFVIGARSALFLPFKNLKIIIVDEEHDLSYKQEEGVTYHARDMAVAYANFINIPIVLCSATPSIETVHNVRCGKYQKAFLANRYYDVDMPSVSIVNMKNTKLAKGEWISHELREKVSNALTAGSQVMLFLNRKGYAPVTLCSKCGHREKCVSCESYLVAYKETNKMLCHYCGFTKYRTSTCAGCNSNDTLVTCGPGVEKIEEETRKLWPEAKVITVTQDSVNKDNFAAIVASISAKEFDIVICTQILSKGYHFPMLNLVGVIDADIGLIGADLRASEKTYQLLNQLSGRSGRENKGEVVIQSYYPESDVLAALSQNNVQDFYDSEIQIRKIVNMPPFKTLVSLVVSGQDHEKLKSTAQLIASAIPYTKEINVLGPVIAPISRLRGRYRYRFLIKADANINVQKYINDWLKEVKIPSSIRLKADVNPYSFL